MKVKEVLSKIKEIQQDKKINNLKKDVNELKKRNKRKSWIEKEKESFFYGD